MLERARGAQGHGRDCAVSAIDEGAWPPQALVRCARGDAVVLVTCGMHRDRAPVV